MTTPGATRGPIAAPDAVSPAALSDELQQVRETAAALLAQGLDQEATTRLLQSLQQKLQVGSPSPPYQYIRDAYAEHASNIHFSWQQVGDYLRNAMRAAQAERGLTDHGDQSA